MKPPFSFFQILGLICLWPLTFVQGQDFHRHLPDDAFFVVAVHGNHIDEKVSIEDLKQIQFVQTIMEMAGAFGADEQAQAFMNNPKEFGLDLMQPMYLAVSPQRDNPAVTILMRLTDRKKFQSFISAQTEGMLEIENAGDYAMLNTPEGMLGWNNQMLVFSSVDVPWEEKYSEEEGAYEAAQREARVNRLSEVLKGGFTLAAKKGFSADLATENDVSMWIDYAPFQEIMNGFGSNYSMDPTGMASMGLLKSLYEETYANAALNFEQGHIHMGSNYYYGPKMDRLMKSATKGRFNKDFSKFIPANNLGYYGLAYDLEEMIYGIEDLMMPSVREMPMFGEMIDQGLDVLGIFVDEEDTYNLVQGDMLFTVTGVEEVQVVEYDYDEDYNEIETVRNQPIPLFNLMLTTGNTDNMEKVIRLAESSPYVNPEGPYFTINAPEMDLPFGLYLAMVEDVVLLTNDQDLVQNRLATGYVGDRELAKSHRKRLKKHSQAMYVDFTNTMTRLKDILPPDMQDPMVTNLMDQFGEVLKDAVVTTNKKVKNGALHSDIYLNFENENRNGLEQLMNFINETYFSLMMMGS